MGIKINPMDSSARIERTRRALEKTHSQLSSAQRIARAGDDAAGLAISENLRAAERAFHQGVRNLSDGISVSQTAQGALSEISNNLGRMRELTVQAGNGILDDQQKAAIQAEYDQLSSEITRIAESTTFGGRQLLNGETSGTGAMTLRDGTGGASDAVQVSIGDVTAGAIGVEGLAVTDGTTLDRLDEALARVSQEQGELGTVENRLRSGIRNLQNTIENTAAANSRIRDTDVAKAAADKVKNQLLNQMGVSVQAQANISASMALHLLQ
jgi:flagellin